MNTFEGRLSKRLMELRIAAGLSQEQAAEKIGVTKWIVFQWENGRSQPSLSKFPLISEAYGISIEGIFKNF